MNNKEINSFENKDLAEAVKRNLCLEHFDEPNKKNIGDVSFSEITQHIDAIFGK